VDNPDFYLGIAIRKREIGAPLVLFRRIPTDTKRHSNHATAPHTSVSSPRRHREIRLPNFHDCFAPYLLSCVLRPSVVSVFTLLWLPERCRLLQLGHVDIDTQTGSV